jgi:hypothetical protein
MIGLRIYTVECRAISDHDLPSFADSAPVERSAWPFMRTINPRGLIADMVSLDGRLGEFFRGV